MGEEKPGAAPQISLEHILAMKSVADAASALEDEAKKKYEDNLASAVEGYIKRKRCYWSLKHFWQVRDIVGKSFFKPGGQYREVERQVFKEATQDYPPLLGEVAACLKAFRKAYAAFLEVKSKARELHDYASQFLPAQSEEESDDVQLRLFTELLPLEEEKMSMHIDKLFVLVNDYNSAAAALVPGLPDVGEEKSDDEEIASNVSHINNLLASLRSGFYTVETLKKAGLLLEALGRVSSSLAKMNTSFEQTDFDYMGWDSDKFESHLKGLGFDVIKGNKYYSNRGYRPGYAVRWVQKK